MKSRTLQAALCALGGAALALGLRASGLLDGFERGALDAQLRWKAVDPEPRTEAVLVYIDEHCIDYYRREARMGWPWRREMYAYLLEACAESRAVIFDLIFVDPSAYTKDDEAFAEALAAHGRAYVGVTFGDVPDPGMQPELKLDPDIRARPARTYYSAVPPVTEIADAARGAVHVRATVDPDGVNRRYDLAVDFRGRSVPSPAVAALHAMGRTVDRETLHLTYRTASQPFPVIDAAALIQGEVDPSILRDRVVIVAPAAAALGDIRATPLQRQTPGATIHAYALADLLDGRRLDPADAGTAAALVLAAALAAAFSMRLLPGAAAVLVTLGVAAALPAVTVRALEADRWWPLIAMELSLGAAALIAAAVNYAVEGRRRRQVKAAFSHYVSAGVVEKLLRDPDAITLGGERKTLTVLFLDFAGFTSMSEKLEPAEAVRILNEYHSLAVEEILAADGTWNKFIGDAVMAFWGEPVHQPDHAARACRAALAVQRRMREPADRLGGLRARIGLNTGPMIVGNMGSATYMDYTVVGDEVNLASRLEGVNKLFGTPILISDSTRAAAGDGVHVRPLGAIRVVGRATPVEIFELLEAPPPADRFAEGLAAYRAGDWARAREAFASVGDKASAYLGSRCAGTPPPNWDGVATITEK